MNAREHRVAVVPRNGLQPVHVFERILFEERRVRISGHMLVHAGVDVHSAERLQIRLRVQGVAGAQFRCHPTAADIEHLAFDALVGPDGDRLSASVGQPHFQRRVGERQPARVNARSAALVRRDETVGREAIESVAEPRLGLERAPRVVFLRQPKAASFESQRTRSAIGHMEEHGVGLSVGSRAEKRHRRQPYVGAFDPHLHPIGLAHSGKTHRQLGLCVRTPLRALAVPTPNSHGTRWQPERFAAPCRRQVMPCPLVGLQQFFGSTTAQPNVG